MNHASRITHHVSPRRPSSVVRRPRSVLMITQDVEVTRRILQEARTLIAAGYEVRILTRSADERDGRGEVEGIAVEWVGVRGRDPRFGWLYKLAGMARGSNAVALWGVMTGRHTFTVRALPRALAAHADIYHAHDLNNLEVAYRAAQSNGAKLVYDAHELFPEMANRWVRIKRRAWSRLEGRLLPKTDLAITVNELIAQEMAKRYGVPAPLVVLNCPDPPPNFDPSERYNHIRERLDLPAERKVVLYQGWMSEGRGLEGLVGCARHLAGDAAVVFMGYGEYQAELEKMAAKEPSGRIYFLPAVSQRDLLAYCASADVGVIPYQAVDLNNYYTSPNKLFDFIQAALPIVASDLPYLRKVIVEDDLGVVAKLATPDDYARAINSVLTRADGGEGLRANLLRAAPGYTWKAQAEKLVEAYKGL
ncbi:MAG TPA: glycosyltransferase family 4 protein [Chloroflexia bacterium]|nr:glycosyltransferase family 4 protein [Chloroflexia bacterium]